MPKKNFEDYMIFKDDEIESAAYKLAIALLRSSPEQSTEELLPWDLSIILPIAEAAQAILKKQGKDVCWPYYNDNENFCYVSTDCNAKSCPYKKEKEAVSE